MQARKFCGHDGITRGRIYSLTFAVLILAPISALAQENSSALRTLRSIHTDEFGVSHPMGVVISDDVLFVAGAGSAGESSESTLTGITVLEDPTGQVPLDAEATDLINLVFDEDSHEVLFFRRRTEEFVRARPLNRARRRGDFSVRSKTNAQRLGLKNPQGMALDQDNRRLFILDSTARQLVSLEAFRQGQGRAETGLCRRFSLKHLDQTDLRGLAFNPRNGHLYVISPSEQELYVLDSSGNLLQDWVLSSLGLREPQGMALAASGDPTDDPAAMSLYVADSGGKTLGSIVEIAIETSLPGLPLVMPIVAPQEVTAQLVQTIETSPFDPPSPDPAGITYFPGSQTFLVSDSEVNETPLFVDVNLFEITPSGSLVDTGVTAFSGEPTGVAYNPADDHLFVSDDVADAIFEVDPGPDGLHGTADDSVTSFDTRLFNGHDPEGVTLNTLTGDLFIVDGLGREVYSVSPGANGVFDGVPPVGDDVASGFDVEIYGVTDPEGIGFDAKTDTLLIGDAKSKTVLQTTTSGTLLRIIDITASGGRTTGLTPGPGSVNPAATNLWIVDRQVDNNSDPDENDGKIYEMSYPELSGNLPPLVGAGPDQSVTLPTDTVVLQGTMTDDGQPDPPGIAVATWSQTSGPPGVTFADVSDPGTTATFPGVGAYVLRLTGDDSDLQQFDEMTATVIDSSSGSVDVRVAAPSDDAEERSSGSMKFSSSDLEFAYDGGGNQTVGMRFNGVNIPAGAGIITAYVQFKVDETNTQVTNLTIQADDDANAAAFTDTPSDISSRPRTSAAVPWSPPPWLTRGESGPDQRTPDIAQVIQEIVSRPGWSPGNSIAIIVTGTGERTAESFEGDAPGAPLLHVDFAASGNLPPTVNAGTDQSIVLPTDTAILDGSVTDDALPAPPGVVVARWTQQTGPPGVAFDDIGNPQTTATFPGAGIYRLRLSGDDSELVAFDEMTVAVTDLSSGSLDVRVASSSDDAEERTSGSMKLTSSDLEFVFDGGGNQTVGMRFNGIQIPAGAQITSANVQFKTDEVNTRVTNLTLQGEASANATTFTATRGDITSRPRTVAAVPWSPPPWLSRGELGPDQQTPDIASVIQEIVSGPGWLPGNSIVILVSGTGERTAESVNGDAGGAALLHVDFSSPVALRGRPADPRHRVAVKTKASRTVFASLANDNFVKDDEVKRIPASPRPEYLRPHLDPVFGNRVIRVSDPNGSIPNVGGTWGLVARHHYSLDQAWNQDQSLLALDRGTRGRGRLFLDGVTYEPLFIRKGPAKEDRWHPTKPHQRIYVTKNQIGTWNVRTGKINVVADVDGYTNFKFGPYKGNPSLDGTHIAVRAEDPTGRQVAFAYDLKKRRKFPDLYLDDVDASWIGISPLGNYVIVHERSVDRTRIHDLQGKRVGPYWSDRGRPSHYDLSVDGHGDEVAVGVSKSDPDKGLVIKRRLRDGAVTVLTKGGYASHTSARNTGQPGWVYVSYNTPSWPPYQGEIVAVKLDGSGTVRRLAHSHRANNGYLTETHASPSPDGSKVIFASNWDDPSGPVAAYVLEILTDSWSL